MGRWGGRLVTAVLTLLCGACSGMSGTIPVESSVSAIPTAQPVATSSGDRTCAPTVPSSSAYCDKEVLLASKDALRGSRKGRLITWQPDRPLKLFEGVRVSPSSGQVVAIDLDRRGLDGFIPPDLGRLSQLQSHRTWGGSANCKYWICSQTR